MKVLTLLYLSHLVLTLSSSLEPYDLRVDTSNSQYTSSTAPTLNWRLQLSPGTPTSTQAIQTAYRILAGGSAASVAAGTLYDSGWVSSNSTLGIPYLGTGLSTPGDTLYWSVTIKDGSQAQSPLSTPVPLTLAPSPTRAGDWGGAMWITHNITIQGSDCECYDPTSNPVPIMRTQFTVPPTASVVAAHLFVAGLGYHEVFLSGRRVGSAASSAPLPEDATGFGLGFGEPGASLGDDVLNPPWTTFAKRVLFSAYNVTGLLAQGGEAGSPQTLGILVGRGMWDPYPMRFFGNKELNFRESLAAIGRPQAIALLHLTLSDGTVARVFTNGVDGGASNSSSATTSATASTLPSPWVWAPGPLTSNNIYIGEGYDARLGAPIAGWMAPGFNASGWSPVFAANPYRTGPLHLNPAPPTRITASFTPDSLTSPLPGLYILAFPANIAGFLSVRGLTGPPGTLLRFTYAEILNASTGDIDPGTNLAGCIGCWEGVDAGPCAPVPALETDTLTLGGSNTSTTSTPSYTTSYTPKFTWHAFRYVRIEGWVEGDMGGPPTPSQFRALAVHVDNAPAGAFASSNPQHAAVDALVGASFRGNWAGGIQSDCPGRERLGYGGDLLASAEAALLQFDVGAFYGKRVDDYVDASGGGGELPETAPFMGIDTCVAGGGGNMQWGSALTELQRLLLHYSGDGGGVVPLAERSWGASVAWLSYLNASATPEGLLDNGLVDGPFNREEGGCGTMAVVFGTAFFARQCANLAVIAEALGRGEEGAPWAARGEQVKAAFQRAFFDPSSGLVGLPAAATAAASGSDGVGGNITVPSAADAQVWALGTGVFEAGSLEESRAAAVLAARLAANGSTAYLGAFATSFFYSHAHEWVPPGGDPSRGLVDAAYAALNTVEFPGYGFMLENGAVALWEHLDTLWDHSSRNHAWYGSVAVFLRRVIGGIGPGPGARGFDRVLIKPIPQRLAAAAPSGGGGGGGGPPLFANTTYDSIRGPITTRWRLYQEGTTPTTTTTFTLRVLLPPNVATTVELPLAPPIEGGAVHKGGSGRGEVVAAWDNPPNFESSCTWLPPPVLDTVRGVARWEFSGFTDCTFSSIWG